MIRKAKALCDELGADGDADDLALVTADRLRVVGSMAEMAARGVSVQVIAIRLVKEIEEAGQ